MKRIKSWWLPELILCILLGWGIGTFIRDKVHMQPESQPTEYSSIRQCVEEYIHNQGNVITQWTAGERQIWWQIPYQAEERGKFQTGEIRIQNSLVGKTYDYKAFIRAEKEGKRNIEITICLDPSQSAFLDTSQPSTYSIMCTESE